MNSASIDCAAVLLGGRAILDAMIDQSRCDGPTPAPTGRGPGWRRSTPHPTQPNMLSRKYITGAAAQPSEPPTPWMLKARPSRPGFTEALSSAKSAGWNTELPSAGDHRDGGEAHEGMRHRYQRQCNADGEQAAGQDRPRAEAVDGEARPGLGDAGHAVEDAGQQADIRRSSAPPPGARSAASWRRRAGSSGWRRGRRRSG